MPELTENHKSYAEWIRKFFGENAYKNMHKFENVDLTVIWFFYIIKPKFTYDK